MNSRRKQKEKETHTDAHIEPLKNRIEANKREKKYFIRNKNSNLTISSVIISGI